MINARILMAIAVSFASLTMSGCASPSVKKIEAEISRYSDSELCLAWLKSPMRNLYSIELRFEIERRKLDCGQYENCWQGLLKAPRT
jgi:hypothetical protein